LTETPMTNGELRAGAAARPPRVPARAPSPLICPSCSACPTVSSGQLLRASAAEGDPHRIAEQVARGHSGARPGRPSGDRRPARRRVHPRRLPPQRPPGGRARPAAGRDGRDVQLVPGAGRAGRGRLGPAVAAGPDGEPQRRQPGHGRRPAWSPTGARPGPLLAHYVGRVRGSAPPATSTRSSSGPRRALASRPRTTSG
jgi:hypothetical protein